MHLLDTLLAVESRAKAGQREKKSKLQHYGGGGGGVLIDGGLSGSHRALYTGLLSEYDRQYTVMFCNICIILVLIVNTEYTLFQKIRNKHTNFLIN